MKEGCRVAFKKFVNKQKKYHDGVLLILSGMLLGLLLYFFINNINASLVERDNMIIQQVHMTIKALEASQIPSIEQRSSFLTEAVSTLSTLGVRISGLSILYLMASYLAWMVFIGSCCRIGERFYYWLSEN